MPKRRFSTAGRNPGRRATERGRGGRPQGGPWGGLHPRPVRGRRRHRQRKGTPGDLATARAADLVDSVCGDVHPRHQLEDLATVHGVPGSLGWQAVAAATANAATVRHDVVRACAELQAMPGMTGLTTERTTTIAAQALGRRLAVAITGRWLATLAAVLAQPSLQFAGARLQRLDLLMEGAHQVGHLLWRAGAQTDDLFFGGSVHTVSSRPAPAAPGWHQAAAPSSRCAAPVPPAESRGT